MPTLTTSIECGTGSPVQSTWTRKIKHIQIGMKKYNYLCLQMTRPDTQKTYVKSNQLIQ